MSLLDVTPAYIGTSVEERDGESHILEERSIEDAPEIVEDAPEQEKKETNIMAELKCRRLKLGGKL